jgi:hypothetical protein
MVESRQSRAGEQFLEKFERLSFHDQQKVDQVKEALKEHYYSQFPFKPNIDKLSASLAPPRSCQELYKDELREYHLQTAKQAAERAFHEIYTFQPQLHKSQFSTIEPSKKVHIWYLA